MKNKILLKGIGKINICKNDVYHRNKKVKSRLENNRFRWQNKFGESKIVMPIKHKFRLFLPLPDFKSIRSFLNESPLQNCV